MADERTAQNIVTSENLAEFNAKKLDLEIPVLGDKEDPPVTQTKIEEKMETKTEEKVAEPKKDKKHDINERFSKMAEDRKAAEAKAAAAEVAAKTEREAREKVEREAAELREKLKPKETPVQELPALPPEPLREKYASDADFAKAVAEHAVAKAMRERDEKERKTQEEQIRSRVVETWEERLASTKKDVPDYDERIAKSKDVVLSNQARDAILESAVGPKMLLHFADHPDEAKALGKLSLAAMYKQLGKIEAMIESAPSTKTVTPASEKTPTVEISKAPEPATPLKGSAAGSVELFDSKGEFKGDYQQWKAARRAGKIK